MATRRARSAIWGRTRTSSSSSRSGAARARERLAPGGQRTVRIVEPHYLLLSWPAWYLLVWDHLRGAVRMLRVDRIESASVQAATFQVRNSESMLATLGDIFAAL
nr:WYL domain-containing protein [Myxococcus xanthus]